MAGELVGWSVDRSVGRSVSSASDGWRLTRVCMQTIAGLCSVLQQQYGTYLAGDGHTGVSQSAWRVGCVSVSMLRS